MTWTHVADRVRKARKEHKCFLCGSKIGIGTKYIERAGIHSGVGRESLRMHVPCEEISSDWDVMDWETFSEGDLDPDEYLQTLRENEHAETETDCL